MSNLAFNSLIGVFLVASIIPPAFRFIPGENGRKLYYLVVVVNGLAIITTIIVSYANLLRVIRRVQASLERNVNSRFNEKRLTRIAVMLITMYTCSLLPMIAYHLVALYALKWREENAKLYVIAITIIALQGVINPVMYYYANEGIRTKFMTLVRHRTSTYSPPLLRTNSVRSHRTNTTPHTPRADNIRLTHTHTASENLYVSAESSQSSSHFLDFPTPPLALLHPTFFLHNYEDRDKQIQHLSTFV
jgi:hypothetical protein